MAARLTNPTLATRGDLGTVYTEAIVPVGSVSPGIDASGNYAEYVFLKGVASLVVGSWVTYDEAGVTALLAANAVGPVAVATALTDASTKFGWFQIRGQASARLAANCADNAFLGRETADGDAGDGAAAGDVMYGAVSRQSTAGAAAVGTVQILYPSVNDKSA